jgi:hypothetical protein
MKEPKEYHKIDFEKGVVENIENGEYSSQSFIPRQGVKGFLEMEIAEPSFGRRLTQPVLKSQNTVLSRWSQSPSQITTPSSQATTAMISSPDATYSLSPEMAKSRLNDMVMKADYYKLDPSVSAALKNIDVSNLKNPIDFYTKIYDVLKSKNALTPQIIEGLNQTTKDFYMVFNYADPKKLDIFNVTLKPVVEAIKVGEPLQTSIVSRLLSQVEGTIGRAVEKVGTPKIQPAVVPAEVIKPEVKPAEIIPSESKAVEVKSTEAVEAIDTAVARSLQAKLNALAAKKQTLAEAGATTPETTTQINNLEKAITQLELNINKQRQVPTPSATARTIYTPEIPAKRPRVASPGVTPRPVSKELMAEERMALANEVLNQWQYEGTPSRPEETAGMKEIKTSIQKVKTSGRSFDEWIMSQNFKRKTFESQIAFWEDNAKRMIKELGASDVVIKKSESTGKWIYKTSNKSDSWLSTPFNTKERALKYARATKKESLQRLKSGEYVKMNTVRLSDDFPTRYQLKKEWDKVAEKPKRIIVNGKEASRKIQGAEVKRAKSYEEYKKEAEAKKASRGIAKETPEQIRARLAAEKKAVAERRARGEYTEKEIKLGIDNVARILRGTKGMTASDIMKKYPDIQLKKDVKVIEVDGDKSIIKKGESFTPYELKGNKVLLQDGETYIVSKNQFQNIKGNSISNKVKEFAPELKGTEEAIKVDVEKTFGIPKAMKEFDAGKEVYGIDDEGIESLIQTRDDIKNYTNFALEKDFTPNTTPTKYSRYQLPGGKNYKEILIKAPTKALMSGKEAAIELEKRGLPNNTVQIQNLTYDKNNTFQSSHWPHDQNVIAHLRMNERTYNGKKVAFMEELQSDWAREGRDKGFNTMDEWKSGTKLEAKYIELPTWKGWAVVDENGRQWYTNIDKEAVINKAREMTERGGVIAGSRMIGVPNNPLLKKWQELSIKRALKEAVDNGSDYFAWINGEQTSARYNLSTKLKKVSWKDSYNFSKTRKDIELTGINGENVGRVEFKTDGIITDAPQNSSWKGKKLDEVLGKGLADKIMAKESGTLSGEGLKFGGEWANNLYDKQVGNIVSDLTGAKIEKLDMELPIDKTTKEWRIVEKGKAPYTFKTLDKDKIKVGLEVHSSEGTGESYIITNILGDGKFKAIPKQYYEPYKRYTLDGEKDFLAIQPEKHIKTFDISAETTTQQGIRITPEIRALIKGEPRAIVTSGKMFEKVALRESSSKKIEPSDDSNYYFSKESKPLADIEKRSSAKANLDDFKLYEEGYRLIKKYAKKISEKYVPRGTAGVAFKGGDISVKSLNDTTTVVHEIAHVLDRAGLISEKLLQNKTGNSLLIKQLKDVYMTYYGRANKSASLKTKVVEGFATLVERYVATPTKIKEAYPDLVKSFLTDGGEFYSPIFKEFIKDAESIIERYQGLTSIKKIESRLYNEDMKIDKDSFFNTFDNIREFVFDNEWNMEKVALSSGKHLTADDPSAWLRFYNKVYNVINNNITAKKGYWTLDNNGNYYKKYDYNWNNLVSLIEKNKLSKKYGAYLVARRSYFDFMRLDELKADSVELEKIADLEATLSRDKISRQEATDAYLENKEAFKEYDDIFDSLTNADLELLHNPMVRILGDDVFKELSARKGYASEKRLIIDEFGNSEGPVQFINKGTSISSLKGRKGSSKTIINPLKSAIQNHAEIMRKAVKQIVYNKMLNIADLAPEVFRVYPIEMSGSGKNLFIKQSDDPNFIFARDTDGSLKAVMVHPEIQKVLEVAFDVESITTLEKIIKFVSRTFIKGTTGWNPFFTLSNVPVDAISMIAQTRNSTIPLLDISKQMIQAYSGKRPEYKVYAREYFTLGGAMQTFQRMYEQSPEDLFKYMTKDKTIMGKIEKGIDVFTNIISAPAYLSEVQARLAEYINARKAGKSQIVAMEEAGRVTASFHHHGRFGRSAKGAKLGKTAISAYPYTNAKLQVLHTQIRALEDPKTRGRAMFMIMALGALSALQVYRMYQSLETAKEIGGETYEKTKKMINDLRSLDTYYASSYLYYVGGERIVKTKIPSNYNILGSALTLYLMNEFMDTKFSGMDFIKMNFDTILLKQLDVFDPAGMAASYAPYIIKPEMMTALGKKDFPKVANIEPSYMQYIPPEDRYFSNTNKFAVFLGKLMKVSPLRIEYYIKQKFGFMADFAVSGLFNEGAGVINVQEYADRINKALSSKVLHEQYMFTGKRFDDFYKAKEQVDKLYESDKKNREYMKMKTFYDNFYQTMSDYKKIERANVEIPLSFQNEINDILDLIIDGKLEEAMAAYSKLSGKSFISNNLRLIEKNSKK